jgi:hypothetical protein
VPSSPAHHRSTDLTGGAAVTYTEDITKTVCCVDVKVVCAFFTMLSDVDVSVVCAVTVVSVGRKTVVWDVAVVLAVDALLEVLVSVVTEVEVGVVLVGVVVEVVVEVVVGVMIVDEVGVVEEDVVEEEIEDVVETVKVLVEDDVGELVVELVGELVGEVVEELEKELVGELVVELVGELVVELVADAVVVAETGVGDPRLVGSDDPAPADESWPVVDMDDVVDAGVTVVDPPSGVVELHIELVISFQGRQQYKLTRQVEARWVSPSATI